MSSTSEVSALPGKPPAAGQEFPAAFEPRTPPRPKPAPRPSPYAVNAKTSAFAALVLLVCLFGLGQLLRRATAENWAARGDRESVERATAWTSGNSAAWLKLASLQSHEGEDAEAIESLRRAAAALPFDPAPRREFALALEQAGKIEEASVQLREAAGLDRSFVSRWTLANFYLRTGQTEEFWPWIRQAIEFDPARLPLAMDLCWRAFGAPDGERILELAIPDTPDANRAYFAYLLDSERVEPMRNMWPRVEPDLTAADVPNVALYLDRLLLADYVEDAVEAWNRLSERDFVPLEPLSIEEGPYLTNGDFVERVSGLGFDWKIPRAEGVGRRQVPGDNGEYFLEVVLSGGQAEYTPVIIQMLPIGPGRRYALIYEYLTQQLPAETGIGWVVRDGRTEQPVATPPPLENAEDFWYETSFSFDAPADARLLQLELKYERVPGTARERGRFLMRNVRLELLAEVADDEAAK